jgi:MFS family permease
VLRARQERVLLSRARLWTAVAALSVDQLVAWGVLYYAYAVLVGPIARDLEVSRLVVAAAFSITLLTAGWFGRRLGPVLDARGTRGVLRAGAIAAPVAFAAIALAGDVVSLFVVFALLGVAQALCLYEPAFRTLVDWCADDRGRARAMLAVTSVGGFASTVFLPLTTWLVARLGWRAAVATLAALLALTLIPGRNLLPLSDRSRAGGAPRRTPAPRSASRLAVGLAMHALASTGVFLTLLWHLVERGESAGAAAAMAGLAGAAQVPGRLISAPLRRITGATSFLIGLLVVQALALAGIVALSGPAATACILVFGAASGTMTLERANVLVEWYGRSDFGAHQGRLAAATSTTRAIAPFVVEVGHLVTSYAVLFGGLAFVLLLAAGTCRSAARLRAAEAGS